MSVVPSPIDEAEQSLQVAAVLRRTHQRFAEGRWERGRQFAPGDRGCLVGGLRDASRWTRPEVETRAITALVAHLPQPLRTFGRLDPRWALMVANDLPGGRNRVMRLLEATMQDLGLVIAAAPTVEPSPPTSRTGRGRWTVSGSRE